MFFPVPHVRRGRTVSRPGSGESPAWCGLLVVALMVAALVGVPYYSLQAEASHVKRWQTLQSMLKVPFRTAESARPGDAVYLRGARVEDAVVRDEAFGGLVVTNALALERRAEYCQWDEFRHTNCQECTRRVRAKDGSTDVETYPCNCVTDYTYVKGWRPAPRPSVLFDQPAAHHNPLRDPFPSRRFVAESATLALPGHERFELRGLDRVRAKLRKLKFRPGGSAPRTRKKSWWFSPQQPFDDKRARYEALSALPRRLPENFAYVGDGYFYSAYESTTAEALLKGFFQFAEGTLFDWQLGDLLAHLTGTCTAGDVRVSYFVKDPKKLSVLSTLRDEHGRLGDSAAVSTVAHAGKRSPAAMIAKEASISVPFWGRLLLAAWAVPFSSLVAAFFGFDFLAGPFLSLSLAVAALATTLLSDVWLLLYDGTASASVAMLSLVSFLVFLLAIGSLPRTRASPGPRAAWCMLAKAAGLPPDWRVQASYRGGEAPPPSTTRRQPPFVVQEDSDKCY